MPTTTLNGSFDYRDDPDYFRVDLVAGQRYLFRMSGSGSNPLVASTIDLFTPDGTGAQALPVVEDGGDVSLGGAAFAFVARESGTHYLLATLDQARNASPSPDKGTYSVSVTQVALDDHSDLRGQGTLLSLGTTVAGAFDLRHDLDYFRVTLAAGQRYLFSMNGGGASPVFGNTAQLFAPDGTHVTLDSAQTEQGGAKFAYQAETAGTYFFLATSDQPSSTTGVDSGSYSVSVNPVALDDHSDLPAQGTHLNIGGSLTGQFDLRHDRDYFRVDLVAGQRYLFGMIGSGANPAEGSALGLFGPGAGAAEVFSSLVFDADTTEHGGALFAFVPRESGTFALLAQLVQQGPNGDQDQGSYLVSVNAIALDDHADLREQGTVLNSGATLSGAFDQPHDKDYFRVNLSAGQRYLFTLSATGANPISAPQITLFDPDNLQVAHDLSFSFPGFASDGARFAFVAARTGTYYLLADVFKSFSGTPGSPGTYQVQLAQVALDDHSDLRDTGTVLNIGSQLAGHFDLRHDLDYFRATLGAGQRYLFTMTGAGGDAVLSSDLQLQNAAGDVLIEDNHVSIDGGAAFVFQAPSAGTYYLLATNGAAASAFGGSDAGSYSVRAQQVALDDHSDLRLQGTVLDAGAPPMNHPPSSADGSASLMEDTPLSATLPAATDSDGDSLVYAKASDPAHGSVNVSSLGGYTYTPNADFNGVDAFNFSVSDGKGGVSTYAMHLSVAAVNDAPQLVNPIADQGAVAGAAYNFVVPADRFMDVDNATLIYSAVQESGAALPSWLTFNAATRSFSGTPQVANQGSLNVKVVASDGSLSASDVFVLTIAAAPNVAPTASNGNASTAEDTPLNASLPAASDGNGDPITYAKTSEPAHGSLVVNANGSYVYTPAANFNGSDSFGFSVSDGRGGSNSYTESITITAVNDTPTGTVAIIGTARLFETLTSTSTVADADGLGALSYQWLRGGVAIAGATQSSYTLGTADIGSPINLRLRYTDGGGTQETVSATATAAVLGYNAIIGTAGNDSLPGTSGPDSITGLAGNDTLSGGAGIDVLDGGAGIDTAAFAGNRAGYTLARAGAGYTVAASAADTDTLSNIERLKFADLNLAIDIEGAGAAGTTAKIIGAVFGKPFLSNQNFVGIGLNLLDGGMSYPDLVALAVGTDLFAQLAGSRSNTDFVKLVYKNVVGINADAAALNLYVGMLERGEFTQSSLAFLACETDLNKLSVDLVGLANTGIAFVPGG